MTLATEQPYHKAGCFSELSPLSEDILLHESRDFLAHYLDKVPAQAVFSTCQLLQLREKKIQYSLKLFPKYLY